MSDNQLITPFAQLSLDRIPLISKEPLRAWDAADEYLLNHLNQTHNLAEGSLLLINDQFGALACSLNTFSPTSWSDSFISHLATAHNLKKNNLDKQVNYLPSTENPKGQYSTVLIKIPKTQALLEQQLSQLRSVITPKTAIIAAGMSKHIHTSTLRCFEELIGSTYTSLAVKKARLIFSQLDEGLTAKSPVYPSSFYDEELELTLSNHANVFAKEKLDIGARFFIKQFGALPKANSIIDLGCGNGVLGIMAKKNLPDAHIAFVDESYMAVDSARANFEAVFPGTKADFYHSDCLSQVPPQEVDLILCNPPFHQQHAIGDHIAWQMFTQSQEYLKEHGELWVVGNRHLNYHIKLKRVFGNCKIVASDRKFVVLKARKN